MASATVSEKAPSVEALAWHPSGKHGENGEKSWKNHGKNDGKVRQVSVFPVFSKLQSWDWGIEDILNEITYIKPQKSGGSATGSVKLLGITVPKDWFWPKQVAVPASNCWMFDQKNWLLIQKQHVFFLAQKVRIERGGLTDNNWKVLMDKNVDGVHEPKNWMFVHRNRDVF